MNTCGFHVRVWWIHFCFVATKTDFLLHNLFFSKNLLIIYWYLVSSRQKFINGNFIWLTTYFGISENHTEAIKLLLGKCGANKKKKKTRFSIHRSNVKKHKSKRELNPFLRFLIFIFRVQKCCFAKWNSCVMWNIYVGKHERITTKTQLEKWIAQRNESKKYGEISRCSDVLKESCAIISITCTETYIKLTYYSNE